MAATEPADRPAGKPSLRSRLVGDVRTRIIASYLVLLTLSGIASVLIVRQVLLVQLDDQINAELVQEADEFRQLVGGIDPRTGEPFAGDVDRIFDVFLDRNIPGEGQQLVAIPRRGVPVFRGSVDAQLRLDPSLFTQWRELTDSERGELETAAGPARYLAIPIRNDNETVGTFVVVNFLAGPRADIDDAVAIVGSVAAVILVIGTLAAFLSVGRILAPLRDLRDAARSVSGSDLTRRIEVDGDDELAELGHTFNRMLGRLELAFASQREFIRDAGHELRTPIAIVRGHLELFAEEQGHDTERRETLELLSGELDRMTRFVNDMLLLAKAERPDFLRLETVHLRLLCEELLAKSQALGNRDWILDGTADATIVADRQRLTQAVVNLVDNAVASTINGQQIAIGCSLERRQARIWVRDRGRGIAPEEQELILEPFRRGRGSRYEGSGLGLPIVTAIVTAHGGSLDIESAPGSGTKVILRFPLEGPETETMEEELR